MNAFLTTLQQFRSTGRKSVAILIDPDKTKEESGFLNLMELIRHSHVDFIFIGGSLLIEDLFSPCVKRVKENSSVPVILFPGSPSQISNDADGILFLSLISGRNPDLLIGQHVIAAPQLAKTKLEIIPTGYMLVDCGLPTTASYISQTFPIPHNKPEIAAATALAGEMLGLKCFYLDGGSGAANPISPDMIRAVSSTVKHPVIVGGGIKTETQARSAFEAGADLIVVGTAFEEDPELLFAISHSKND